MVASDIPPHVEVIAESRPGARLVAVDDEAALSRGITDALADLDAERDGAAALRDAVIAHYDWDRATDLLETLYLDVSKSR